MADAQTEKIINEVRRYPELYSTRHPDHKNVFRKELAWRKIQKNTGLDVKSLKSKWKNLRDTYKKYKQSQLECSGQAKKYANWMWAEQMRFVKFSTNLRSSKRSRNISPPQLQIPETSENIDEPIIKIFENQAQEYASLSNIAETGSDHRRKRRRNIDPSDETNGYSDNTKIPQPPTTNTGQNLVNILCDKLDMTFLGFADSVKKFSRNNQAVIKLEITKLITEYELKENMTIDSEATIKE